MNVVAKFHTLIYIGVGFSRKFFRDESIAKAVQVFIERENDFLEKYVISQNCAFATYKFTPFSHSEQTRKILSGKMVNIETFGYETPIIPK